MNKTKSSYFICPICNSECLETETDKKRDNKKINVLSCTNCDWNTEVTIRHEIEGVAGHEGLYASFSSSNISTNMETNR